MSTEPITPAARAAVEALLDDTPVESSAIQFLLDGLGVESISELKQLVDAARHDEPERRFMEDRAGIYSTAIGLARLALRDDDSAKARKRLDEACDEVRRLHWDALLAAGHDPETIELFLGPRDETTTTEVRGDRYYDGFVAGLAAYAYSSSEPWAESGVQYVGTSATTLRDAVAKARETWNYAG